jgi:hypothetical protein
VWLLRENKGEPRPYSPGDRLPFGADVFPGDTLVGFGQGLEIDERRLRPGVTREGIAEELRPLLALPVEHVLRTHGEPTDRADLERALASS